MPLRVEDYVTKFRNSDMERHLASELRKQPEEERLRFVQEVLASGHRGSFAVALWLAKTCLRDRRSFEAILNQGLDQADASVIKHWLEAVVNGLGFRRVVAILSTRLRVDPTSVIRARYWLPKWLPRDKKSAVDALGRLNQQIEDLIKENPNLERLVKPIRETD